MTYWRYWQMNGAPFAGGSSRPLFRGMTIEEAIARIEFLVSNRRHVGSLIGATGVGKSSLLRYCAANPPVSPDVPNLRMTQTSLLGLDHGELISDLATILTGRRNFQPGFSAWNTLCDYFQASSREDVQTVLLIDDTESCTTAAEADLSRLISMSFPLTVIFTADSTMLSAISRTLIDRVELQIELPAWEVSQTAEFLAWNCTRMGRLDPVFTDSAIDRIQQLSQGVARRIVQLADLSLVAGAVAQADCVDAECVDQVAWELPKSEAA